MTARARVGSKGNIEYRLTIFDFGYRAKGRERRAKAKGIEQ
jgi:hypothetical protein